MVIQVLKKVCVGDEFDYGMLMSCLQNYRAPHRKITELLRSGDIIRVKKGLYILGDEHRRQAIRLGLLANLIYGPSYVSQEYALGIHGMIPERVEMITSMTNKRNKQFTTPVGVFNYQYINNSRFNVGIDWVKLDDQQRYLLASPEKALADTLINSCDIINASAMLEHLIENLRIDEEVLSQLNFARLQKIVSAYRHPVVNLLWKALQGRK